MLQEQEKNLLEEYLATRHRKMSLSTARTYTKILENVSEYLGKSFLAITREEAIKYAQMEEDKYSINTYGRDIRFLKSFYRFLAIKGYRNAFDQIIPPPQQVDFVPYERIPTKDELDRFMAAAKSNLRNYCIVRLMLTCRFMPVQIMNLKLGSLFVDQTGAYGAEVVSRGGEKTIIPIREDVMEDILNYRLSLLPIGGEDRPLITEEEMDEPVFQNITNLRDVIYGICKKAGIEKRFSPKDLAHLCMIMGLNAHATPDQARRQAGLKSPLSLRKYARQVVPAIQDPMCNLIDIK